MTALDCDRVDELAPELALGIAAGDERARALDHLRACPRCRRTLDGLTGTVESLLVVAPGVEPPAGFEGRVLASFTSGTGGAEGRPAVTDAPVAATGPGRWRRGLAVAAALVLLGGVAAVIGIRRGHDATSPEVTAAALGGSRASGVLRAADGSAVGRVGLVRPGGAAAGPSVGRSALVVDVDAGAPPGRYVVRCDYSSRPGYTVGELTVGPSGSTRWRATVGVPTEDLWRVRLESTSGADDLRAELEP